MATSGGTQDHDTADILCGICEAQHITKCADHWCPECEEGLCSECQKHHSLSKATRTHGIISIENYKKLPKSISEIVHNCKDHEMKVTNYCPKHDTICCPVCISTNHKKCDDLMAIVELIKTAKTSSIIATMEQSLRDMKHNIDIAVKDREGNLSSIRKQRQHYSDEIKQIRVKINSHLDTIEQRIMGDLIDVEENVKLQIANLLSDLSKRSDIINEIQGTILALKEYASDLQTFLGSKSIEVEVEKQEQFVESLSENGSLKQLNIKCSIDNTILDLMSTITTFGSVAIETGPQRAVLKTEKSKQAQIMSVVEPPTLHSINDIKLTLYSNIKIPTEISHRSRGCVICPNGRMLFTDSNNQKLVILNNDGTLDKEITCSPYPPRDVTLIDDSTVAVSTSGDIRIINIDTKCTERVIKTTVRCYGIAYHKGTLLLCEGSRELFKIELSDDRITTLVEDVNLPGESFVTTFGDKIFQTNYVNNSVACYTINGEKLWEFKDESVLGMPVCVAVDNNCNIYVTSYNYNKVIVLSPDGKQCRQLLDHNDGMRSPYGISIDRTTNNILIINSSGPALMYHIS
jgi:DNA-binding beta-propeller fold protein YncE